MFNGEREIGSEFWDVPVFDADNGIFPNYTSWFLSGRNALLSLIKTIKSKKNISSVAIPSWCCDSMIKPFADEGIKIHFYSTCKKIQNIQNIDTDILLIMDYFGFSGYSTVPEHYNGIVIRDLTHSLFCRSYSDADYYFGSLRKWCGIWTGGFAWEKNGNPLFTSSDNNFAFADLRKSGMKKKAQYIRGESNNKDYLKTFDLAENMLNQTTELFSANPRDIGLASAIDAKFIKSQRRANAKFLIEELKQYCVFTELNNDDCPLFVPILIKNRDKVRKCLIEQQIYCPVHWPISDYHQLSNNDVSFYNTELSLICDQRYNENDMKKIVFNIIRAIKLP